MGSGSLGKLAGVLGGAAAGFKQGQEIQMNRHILQIRKDEAENRKRQLEAEISRSERSIAAQEKNAALNSLGFLNRRFDDQMQPFDDELRSLGEALNPLLIDGMPRPDKEQEASDILFRMQELEEGKGKLSAEHARIEHGIFEGAGLVNDLPQSPDSEPQLFPDVGNEPDFESFRQTRGDLDQVREGFAGGTGGVTLPSEVGPQAVPEQAPQAPQQPQAQLSAPADRMTQDPLLNKAETLVGPLGGTVQSPPGSPIVQITVDAASVDSVQEALEANLPEGSFHVTSTEDFRDAAVEDAAFAAAKFMPRLDSLVDQVGGNNQEGERTVKLDIEKDDEGNVIGGTGLPVLDEAALGDETGSLGGIEVQATRKLLNTAAALAAMANEDPLSSQEADALKKLTNQVMSKLVESGVQDGAVIAPSPGNVTVDPFHPAADGYGVLMGTLEHQIMRKGSETLQQDRPNRLVGLPADNIAPLFLSRWDDLVGKRGGVTVPGEAPPRSSNVPGEATGSAQFSKTGQLLGISTKDFTPKETRAFLGEQTRLLIRLRDQLDLIADDGSVEGQMQASTRRVLADSLDESNLLRIRPQDKTSGTNLLLKRLAGEIKSMLGPEGEEGSNIPRGVIRKPSGSVKTPASRPRTSLGGIQMPATPKVPSGGIRGPIDLRSDLEIVRDKLSKGLSGLALPSEVEKELKAVFPGFNARGKRTVK